MPPNNLPNPYLSQPTNYQPVPPTQPVAPPEPPQQHWMKRFLSERGILLPVLLIILIPTLFILYVYRYDISGVIGKNSYSLIVIDAKTQQPLINAKLTMLNQTVYTNNNGIATFKSVKIGKSVIGLSHIYYQPLQSVALVGFSNHLNVYAMAGSSTTKEVPVSVDNKITQKSQSNALITVANTAAMTDSYGQAIINLPASLVPLPTSITSPNYNPLSTSINTQVSNAVNVKNDYAPNTSNEFSLIPSGSVYYLAKTAGGLGLVKSNLDGTAQQVVVQASSYANTSNTQILNSYSPTYIALSMPDSSNTPNLYIYDTQTNKLNSIATNVGGFNINGWTPDNIVVFTVFGTPGVYTNSGAPILEAYNVTKSPKPYVIDEANERGYTQSTYAQENYNSVNVMNDDVIEFSKYWTGNQDIVDSAQTTLNSSKATVSSQTGALNNLELSGSSNYSTPPRVVYTSPTSLALAFTNSSNGKVSYFTYVNGKVSTASGSTIENTINNPSVSSSYYLSPSQSKQLWYKLNTSTNTFYVGDKQGSSVNNIGDFASNVSPYGWWTDNYILLNKGGNALYIAPSSGGNNQYNQQEIASFIP